MLGVGLAPLGIKQWYMGRVFAPWWGMAQVAIGAALLALYLAASWRALRATQGGPFDWSRQRDRWLRALLVCATAVPVVMVAVDVLMPLAVGSAGRPVWVSFVESLLYGGFLYLAALGGLVQADTRIGTAVAPPERKEHYNLDPDLARAHRSALDALVASERPHLDPNLTLGSLARQLGVTDKVLSYVLNETLGTTYTDFVNGLRVEEAQRRLLDAEHAHLSVLGVGLDAGFASKSTFNRVFKERTGQTPSAFRASSPPPADAA